MTIAKNAEVIANDKTITPKANQNSYNFPVEIIFVMPRRFPGACLKQKIRLRSLLLLLALVAVAPGIAALMYSAVVAQHDEIKRANEQLASVTKLVAANQEQLIEGVRQILVTVTAGPSVRRNDLRGLCVEFLRNVQAATPSYANIGLADLNGRIECQAQTPARSMDLSGRRYFRNAIATGKFAIGDYVIGLTTGRPVLGFGMPVYDYNGALRGVAFASLDLEFANRQLQSIALPKYLQIRISDASGKVVVSSAANHLAQLGAPIDDPALRAAMLAHRSGNLSATDADGVEWLHALQQIGGIDRDALMAAVSIRKSDAVAIAKTHFQAQLAIMAAASLLGFVLAWLFARHSLAGPVARLLLRMRRVEQGVDAAASEPAGSSSAEFAELEAGFSSMLEKLQTNEQQLTKAQEITRVGFFQLDLATGVYTASPIVYQIMGLDPTIKSLAQSRYQELIHPDDRAVVEQHRNRLFEGGNALRLQYRMQRPDGAIRWLDGYGFVKRDDAGKPLMYSGAIQDITERKLAEQVARANDARFQLLFEHSLDGVLQTRPDGTIMAANPAACKIFGLTEMQLRERGRDGVVAVDEQRLAALLNERLQTGYARGELTMVRADGSRFEAEVSSSIYADTDGSPVCSMVMRDVTDRLRTEQYIHKLAFFDALTELPNRRLLMDRLAILLAAAQRSNLVGAILFIDLDHFKNVNDARGHATGDALLRQVAQRLSAMLRSEDTVARIGGDEFVILIPGNSTDFVTGAQHAMAIADKVREALAEPFYIDAQPYGSGASIGVTLLPRAGQTTEDLLREADTAMYRAKNGGRNRIAFFESAMQSEVEERLALESDLARAIGTDQIVMHLQPQFNRAGVAVGGELLLRWTHPERGAVSPAHFIPVAEESGLILRLGDWVVHQGCLAVLQLQAAGYPLPVSINVSPRQFRQADFVARVQSILADTGAPASLLIFEVTEGLLIDNLDDTICRMNELVAIGIRFSIDDFGTGYSSLAYLRRMPLYELKIDRSFVQDTPGDTAIVQSILSMAAHLDLRVVAEGVETSAQADFLNAAGCSVLQGYLFARPMPLARWLEQVQMQAPVTA